MYYFADLIDKTSCVGNSLSTINHDLSSLDLALYGVDTDLTTLSAYFRALSASTTAKTDYLSSQIISVSSNLSNRIISVSSNLSTLSAYYLALDASTTAKTNYLSSQIISVSSNLLNTIKTISASTPSFYQQTIYPTGNSINYDFTLHGSNVKTEISSNLFFNNISNLDQGEYGKILLKVYPTSGVSITGWGNQWTFSNTSSTFKFSASAYNMIDYYYSDSRIFAQVARF
jgi:hypothetical protein